MSPRQIFKSNMLFPQIRESGATAPPAASLDIGFRGYRELSNRDEMSHSSALFDLGAGIPCSREKFPAYSLLGRKKFPARPRREFCRKTLESKAFSMLIFAERDRIPCCLPAPQGIPCSRPPNPTSKSRAASANSTDTIRLVVRSILFENRRVLSSPRKRASRFGRKRKGSRFPLSRE